MRELAKSMISFSCAMGMAGAKGLMTLANRYERDQFLKDSERLLRRGANATVDSLGRDLRESFVFADQFQRRTIDAGWATASSLSSKIRPVVSAEDRDS